MAELQLFDPTFTCLQHEPPTPGSTGIVEADLGGFMYRVAFRGRSINMVGAAKAALDVGTRVSVAHTAGLWWCMDAAAGLATRFPRPLGDFAATNPASVFLLIALKDNPRVYLYRAGTIAAKIDINTASVLCWDGITRTLPTALRGLAPAAVLAPGDQALIYCQAPGFMEVLGTFDEDDTQPGGGGGGGENTFGLVQIIAGPLAPDGEWYCSANVSRPPADDHPEITVQFDNDGSAVEGVDFTWITQTVTIPADQEFSAATPSLQQIWPPPVPDGKTIAFAITSVVNGVAFGSPVSQDLYRTQGNGTVVPAGLWDFAFEARSVNSSDLAPGQILTASIRSTGGLNPWHQPTIRITTSGTSRSIYFPDPTYPDLPFFSSVEYPGFFDGTTDEAVASINPGPIHYLVAGSMAKVEAY